MKTSILLLCNILLSLTLLAQRPEFPLVGFGVGTVGGTGGTTVTVTSFNDLVTHLTGTDKKIIKITGKIEGPSGGQIIDVGSNKSLIGVGKDAFLSMINLHLKNSQQIIIQNIRFSMIGSTLGSDADIISVETTSSNEVKYIWIDHCEFYNVRPTLPESASKKDLYDGMIDIKKSSSLITISWNYFHDHWKCSLIGYTATDVYDRKITYHHNYFKDIKSRAPSYRGGTGHIYNNYFDGLNDPNEPTSEAINTREKACLKVENNYFRNYTKTVYCALDDVDFEGFANWSGNQFENSPAETASTCNSFTPPYNYTLTKVEDVPGLVASWSGIGKLDATAYKLTTSVTGHGSVKLEPAGGNYPAGTTITITPIPDNGYAFKSWGGNATGSNATTTVVMDGNKAITANFSTVTGFGDEVSSATSFVIYPSPVGNNAQLRLTLPETSHVSLIIKDQLGNVVLTPSIGSLGAGTSTLELNTSTLSAGIYFCILQHGNTTMSRVFVKE